MSWDTCLILSRSVTGVLIMLKNNRMEEIGPIIASNPDLHSSFTHRLPSVRYPPHPRHSADVSVVTSGSTQSVYVPPTQAEGCIDASQTAAVQPRQFPGVWNQEENETWKMLKQLIKYDHLHFQISRKSSVWLIPTWGHTLQPAKIRRPSIIRQMWMSYIKNICKNM